MVTVTRYCQFVSLYEQFCYAMGLCILKHTLPVTRAVHEEWVNASCPGLSPHAVLYVIPTIGVADTTVVYQLHALLCVDYFKTTSDYNGTCRGSHCKLALWQGKVGRGQKLPEFKVAELCSFSGSHGELYRRLYPWDSPISNLSVLTQSEKQHQIRGYCDIVSAILTDTACTVIENRKRASFEQQSS